jgi:hypothetical protein
MEDLTLPESNGSVGWREDKLAGWLAGWSWKKESESTRCHLLKMEM